MLRYPNGASFVKTCATEYNGFARRQLVLCGSRGTIEIHPLEENRANGLSHTRAYVTLASDNPPPWHEGSEIHEGQTHRYDEMMASFARIVRGEANPYSYDYELALFQTILRCCGC